MFAVPIFRMTRCWIKSKTFPSLAQAKLAQDCRQLKESRKSEVGSRKWDKSLTKAIGALCVRSEHEDAHERIRDACALMVESRAPVTQAFLDDVRREAGTTSELV